MWYNHPVAITDTVKVQAMAGSRENPTGTPSQGFRAMKAKRLQALRPRLLPDAVVHGREYAMQYEQTMNTMRRVSQVARTSLWSGDSQHPRGRLKFVFRKTDRYFKDSFRNLIVLTHTVETQL